MNEATEDSSQCEYLASCNSELSNEIISTSAESYSEKQNPNAGISVNMPSLLSSFSVLNFNSNDSTDLIVSHCITLQVIKISLDFFNGLIKNR